MNKYCVNLKIKDFVNIDIKDMSNVSFNEDEKSEFIVLLDEDCDKSLHEYYKNIEDSIRNGHSVFLIYISGTHVWKPISMMMAMYNVYDVYKAESIDSINSEYIKNIEKRRPTYREESIVHGGEIVAYSKLNTIVLGISNLASEGNLEGMVKFIGQYRNEIDKIVESFDYMRNIVDKSNNSELEDKLAEKEEENIKLYEDIDKKDKRQRLLEIENRDIKKELSEVKEKLNEAEVKVKTAEIVNETGSTGMIRDYPELNTVQINSKVGRILYFKELGRIPYIDSLIWSIVEQLKIMKIKSKLIVYDYDAEVSDIYNPIPVCTSETFVQNKRSFVEKSDKIVMLEPNPSLITDVCRCLPAYDVVIIYDRMKQKRDIIKGNNVTKYYVCNSKKMYDIGVSDFGIKDIESIIALSNLEIHGRYIDIPYIPDYKNCTVNAKISKYMKLIGSKTGESIVKSIFKKSHILEMIENK